MSNIPPTDFDFWEFVCCGRCHLLFSVGNKTVPFWLTDCGHVICNNHLNANQSCSQCGSQGIQLVPLQMEMDSPMSEWFHSIPMALDTVAFAAKFQQETMALQIRYYRSRHQQQRALIDRMKRDISEHGRANENLLDENAQLRLLHQQSHRADRVHDRQSPSSVLNAHGKRQMMEEPIQGRTKTSSSPLSALGHARLTLPQGQHPPQLSSNRHNPEYKSLVHNHPQREDQRPTTGFIEKYAYAPPSTPQYIPHQLSHTQTAPRQFQRSKVNQDATLGETTPATQHSRNMPPPPTPARFKPSEMVRDSNKGSDQNQTQTYPGRRRPMRSHNMGPPPTPALPQQQQSHDSQARKELNTSYRFNMDCQTTQVPLTPSHLLPPERHFAPPSAAVQFQRSQPSTPSIGGPKRFMPSGSKTLSRDISLSESGSGQRVPFVPGGRGTLNFM